MMPQQPYFVPARPVYISPPQPVVTDGLTPAQIDAAKQDWDVYPTFHYDYPDGSGAIMVWVNGQLVPAKPPTHVSYPGEAKQVFIPGKAYPPRNPAPKPTTEGKQGQGCPNPNCKCANCVCVDCQCGREHVGQTLNFGVDESKLSARADRNKYTTNGMREITKTDCNRLLRGDGELIDDSAYDMLAVIGSKEDCDKIRNDVDNDPAFATLRDKLLVQCYQPDDEMIKRKGFAPGSPSINLMDSTGKVKYRESSYRGPKVLAGEIDKRRPDYDPNKDPGPNNPDKPSLPSLPSLDLNALMKHPLFLIVAFFVGLSFLNRKPV